MGLALNGHSCVVFSNSFVPLGILFAAYGMTYRELTIHYSDIPEHRELEEGTRPCTIARFAIGLIVRFFLVLPIPAWLSFVCSWNPFASLYFGIALLGTITLQTVECSRR